MSNKRFTETYYIYMYHNHFKTNIILSQKSWPISFLFWLYFQISRRNVRPQKGLKNSRANFNFKKLSAISFRLKLVLGLAYRSNFKFQTILPDHYKIRFYIAISARYHLADPIFEYCCKT